MAGPVERWLCMACGWEHSGYNVPHLPKEQPVIGNKYRHDFDPTFKWRSRLPEICYGLMKRI